MAGIRRHRVSKGSGRIIALLAAAGIVVPGFAAGVLGMSALQALLAGAICVGLVAPWGRPPRATDITFPAAPRSQSNRGTRREAFRLSWSVATGDHSVGTQLIIRLQRIAGHRLAARGLDLADPADRDPITDRIGDRAYQILTTAPGLDVSRRDFHHTLAAVERLGLVAGTLPDRQPRKDHR